MNTCPSCGTEWEDIVSMSTCCIDKCDYEDEDPDVNTFDVPALLKPQEDLGINIDKLDCKDPNWSKRGVFKSGWVLKNQAC